MSTSLKNTTILVVDDDADICELLRSVLEDAGASVVVAQSARAALDVFRQSPPHAVVADIRLGSSDGYALVETIREFNLEYKGFTPVVAVTGFASRADEERAKTAGFNAYITKPFDPADVVSAIARLLPGQADPAA